MEVFLQALVNGILLGGFYSLMGMGQNIILPAGQEENE